MENQSTSPLYVLTDTPSAYSAPLGELGKHAKYVSSVSDLLSLLTQKGPGGMVLEIPKVMASKTQNRDRLFSFAGTIPVMRARLDPKIKVPVFLDDLECFTANVFSSSKHRLRCQTRVAVKLNCLVAEENDPAMANAFKASVLDISSAGGFIHTRRDCTGMGFVHVRILELDNPRPIYSSVRWAKPDGDDTGLAGMGVMFIDITDDQAEQVEKDYLLPVLDHDA